MVSLRLHPYAGEEVPKVVHYVEGKMEVEEVEELDLDLGIDDDNCVRMIEETSTFQLSPKEGQVTQLGNQLFGDDWRRIQQIIRQHANLFAWSVIDMFRIDLDFNCHKLAICKDAKSIT